MPDPVTTTAATVAATAVAKKADGYLGLLLKPSLELLGKEARAYLKENIDSWKKERKAKNLEGHAAKVAKSREKRGKKEAVPAQTVATMIAFEEWVEGAEEVDPEEPILGQMWQNLLDSLLDGRSHPKELVSILRSLSPQEAQLLATMRTRDGGVRSEIREALFPPVNFRRYFDANREEEKEFCYDRLKTKGVIARKWWPTITRSFIFVCGGGMIVSFFLTFVNGHVSKVGEPLTEFDRVLMMVGCVAGISIMIFAFVVIECRRKYWEPTPLGRALLSYCP